MVVWFQKSSKGYKKKTLDQNIPLKIDFEVIKSLKTEDFLRGRGEYYELFPKNYTWVKILAL